MVSSPRTDLVYFVLVSCLSVLKTSGLYHWFESQALSEAVSSIDVDQLDSSSASVQELMEPSRLNKNKDLLQLLGTV